MKANSKTSEEYKIACCSIDGTFTTLHRIQPIILQKLKEGKKVILIPTKTEESSPNPNE